jgi:AraC-like DNA-binding protein
LSGTICVSVANKKYVIKKGDGIFINTQQLHKIEAVEANALYLFIYFHPNLLDSHKYHFIYDTYVLPLLSEFSIQTLLLSADNVEHKKMIHILFKIESIYTKKEKYYEMDIFSQLIDLWKTTNECLGEEAKKTIFKNNTTNERLKEALFFIRMHYSEHFTLKNVADHINLSRSECSRFFKSATGQTLFQYIMYYRINKSVELLFQTDKSVAEIAYEVGFSSQSYYTKCFTSIKNSTPQKMRKEYKNFETDPTKLNLT